MTELKINSYLDCKYLVRRNKAIIEPLIAD